MFLGFLILVLLETTLRKASVEKCPWWSGTEVEIEIASGTGVGIETGIGIETEIGVEEYARWGCCLNP
jgi:hypothetical protein